MLRRLQFAVATLASIAAVAGVCSTLRAPRGMHPSVASASVTQSRENLSAAVCPVVYQLDDSPGNRGYHYIFYGNAFFINRDGDLLTAAHVLSEFHNGGQPSVLVRLNSAPPRLLKTEVIAVDIEHDVAILRATPNPFAGPRGPYEVIALPLGATKPSIGEGVEATALRPEHLKDPHTFELPIADTYPATVLNYLSIALNPRPETNIPLLSTPSKDHASPSSLSDRSADDSTEIRSAASPSLGKAQIQTDLFLFSHEVQRGQSGAPVASAATHQVVGI
ncbi:MAG: serine protease, partial [Candidatus Acidiferrum sp.]